MIPKYRDSRAGDVAHGVDHVFDLAGTVRSAQNYLLVELERNVLEGFEDQARVLDLLPQLEQVVVFPAFITGNDPLVCVRL